MEPEFFETDGGWGYRVCQVIQTYDPEQPGFVPMSRARAEQLALELQARLTAD